MSSNTQVIKITEKNEEKKERKNFLKAQENFSECRMSFSIEKSPPRPSTVKKKKKITATFSKNTKHQQYTKTTTNDHKSFHRGLKTDPPLRKGKQHRSGPPYPMQQLD